MVLDRLERGQLDQDRGIVAGRIRRRERPRASDPGDLAADGKQRLFELGCDRVVEGVGVGGQDRQLDEDRPIGGGGGREGLTEAARGHGLAVQRRGGDERDRTDEQGPCRDDDRQIRAAAVQDGAPQADRVDQRVSSDVRERVGCGRPNPACGSASPPTSRPVGRAIVAALVPPGLQAQDLVQAPPMTRFATERGAEEGDRALERRLGPDDPRSEREDVHVVVLDALMRGVGVVADGGADPGQLVGRDRGADPGPTDEDARGRLRRPGSRDPAARRSPDSRPCGSEPSPPRSIRSCPRPAAPRRVIRASLNAAPA